MDKDQWNRIKRIYFEARELSGATRQQFLDEACESADEREAVEAQLGQTVPHSFLESPVIGRPPSSTELRVGDRFGRYEILALIGQGGMGVVYKALDAQLRRPVALKFLNTASASEEHRLRFLREARAAAALHHPNICPIYEVVETADRVGLALYWVDGPDLAEWAARQGGVPPALTSVHVVTQLLMGIEAAHKKGIVHRDLKPGNVLIDTNDEVRIVDFGLAHMASEVQITSEGMRLGTPAYMAPEQWEGRETDARTDIWAAGVVFYELLTGSRPFSSHDKRVLGHAVVHEPHDPLRSHRPDLPGGLERIFDRALAKNPNDRFPSAAAMIEELQLAADGLSEDNMTATIGGPPVVRRTASSAGQRTGSTQRIQQQQPTENTQSLAAPPTHSRRWLGLAAASAISAVGTALYLQFGRQKPRISGLPGRSLAVLPFEDRTGENSYLSDGLTDELISNLSKIKTLRVVARNSSFQFRGTTPDLTDIARKLDVDRVLTGSIRAAGDQYRVAVQLVNTEDATVLWGETFSRSKTDVFSIPSEVAGAVMARLSVRADQTGLASRGAIANPEAYNLYLQGLYQWNLRSPAAFESALKNFRAAIDADRSFPLAWAGLADTQVLRALFGIVAPIQAMEEAKMAAQRALSLDANLAEAHNSLGLIGLLYDWKRAEAEASHKRALELNPGYATGHHFYGHFLAWSARFTEAFAELDIAQNLDPLSLAIRTNIGWLQGLNRRFDEGIAKLRSVLTMDSRFVRAHLYLGTLLGHVGKYEAAMAELRMVRELSGESASVISTEAWLEARNGRMDRAAELKQKLLALSEKTYVTPPEMVMVCIAMGQREESLKWLDKAVAERAPTLVWAGLDFRFDHARRDPAFLDVLRKFA